MKNMDSEPALPPSARPPIIDETRRVEIERENRAQLERELFGKELTFASRPYQADIQFSNFCNLSCIMCYDGANPPVQRMSPEIVRKVSEQVAPTLSLVNPFGGSEPLILTWSETRTMAEQYSLLLDVTTHAQFLDEAKFLELKDITQTLFFSIDSHIPEVYEKIRVRSDRQKVFANLERAGRLCKEHGVECMVNVVLMTENAAQLPETVAFMADLGIPTLNTIQLVDFNGHSDLLDPLVHYSAEYIEHIKQRCIEVAREKKSRFIWSVAGFECHDFREDTSDTSPRKQWNDHFTWRVKHHLPGLCKQSHNRIKIEADGRVYPCCYANDGDLLLGDLNEKSFDEIWNGPEARDLRRGMLTWDVPSLCRFCRFRDLFPVEKSLPFVEWVVGELGPREGLHLEAAGEALRLLDPPHMMRSEEPPTICIENPTRHPVARYLLVWARGGETEEIETMWIEADKGGATRFRFPTAHWVQLATNTGYWWTVWGVAADGSTVRADEIRCWMRHEALPRVPESSLEYLDEGFVPVRDLGGAKQAGWTRGEAKTVRPTIPSDSVHPPGVRAFAKRVLRRLGLVRSKTPRQSE